MKKCDMLPSRREKLLFLGIVDLSSRVESKFANFDFHPRVGGTNLCISAKIRKLRKNPYVRKTPQIMTDYTAPLFTAMRRHNHVSSESAITLDEAARLMSIPAEQLLPFMTHLFRVGRVQLIGLSPPRYYAVEPTSSSSSISALRPQKQTSKNVVISHKENIELVQAQTKLEEIKTKLEQTKLNKALEVTKQRQHEAKVAEHKANAKVAECQAKTQIATIDAQSKIDLAKNESEERVKVAQAEAQVKMAQADASSREAEAKIQEKKAEAIKAQIELIKLQEKKKNGAPTNTTFSNHKSTKFYNSLEEAKNRIRRIARNGTYERVFEGEARVMRISCAISTLSHIEVIVRATRVMGTAGNGLYAFYPIASSVAQGTEEHSLRGKLIEFTRLLLNRAWGTPTGRGGDRRYTVPRRCKTNAPRKRKASVNSATNSSKKPRKGPDASSTSRN